MGATYWTRIASSRASRRRALAGGAALGLGAVALAACGGGDGDGDSPRDAAGLLHTPSDATARAKPGGTYQGVLTANIVTLDSLPAPNNTTARSAAGFLYSRILKFKPGYLKAPTGEVEGDIAESWEVSGDKLQITLKLRDMQFDARPPTSGRRVSAQDVLFSWNKFSNLSSFRGDLFNGASAAGPIASMSAPDDRTVIVKLAFPDSLALPLLASAGHLAIQPVEADGGFDPRIDARGSGPWILERNEASVGVEYRRNPNWYRKDRPFLNGYSLPIVPEYATQLASFRAGNIWSGVVRQEDILPVKSDLPRLLLMSSGEYPQAASRLFFGHLPADTPFRDERVRQALSMAIDRDQVIDIFSNVSNFQKAGLDVQTRYHSSIPCGWDGAWLDPRDTRNFGPNAFVYQHNLGEVKKLLSAAGYPNGFEFDLHYSLNAGVGNDYVRYVEVVAGMATDAGMKAKLVTHDSGSDFVPNYVRGKNKFTGITIYASSAQVDPVAMVTAWYHSGGAMAPDLAPFTPEPDIDKMIEDMHREFDLQKRITMLHDFQRIMAKRARIILHPGAAPPYSLTWPWVGNAGVYRAYGTYGAPTESLIHLWYDESQRTA